MDKNSSTQHTFSSKADGLTYDDTAGLEYEDEDEILEGTWGIPDPERDGKWYRVGDKGAAEEPLLLYEDGGYHPVHLGDTMREKRYTIARKLGWGRRATVWLAKDSYESRSVALKIFQGDTDALREFEAEKNALSQLVQPAQETDTNPRHASRLLDHFVHRGPNGEHPCLITEALGPKLSKCMVSMRWRWAVAKRMMEIIAFVHQQGLSHGNPRLSKFLVTDTKWFFEDDDTTKQLRPAETYDVQPLDDQGEPQTGAVADKHVVPQLQYLTSQQGGNINNHGVFLGGENPQVKLVGFGNVVPAGEERFLGFELYGQAPEIEFGESTTTKSDIWSLGHAV